MDKAGEDKQFDVHHDGAEKRRARVVLDVAAGDEE